MSGLKPGMRVEVLDRDDSWRPAILRTTSVDSVTLAMLYGVEVPPTRGIFFVTEHEIRKAEPKP